MVYDEIYEAEGRSASYGEITESETVSDEQASMGIRKVTIS